MGLKHLKNKTLNQMTISILNIDIVDHVYFIIKELNDSLNVKNKDYESKQFKNDFHFHRFIRSCHFREFFGVFLNKWILLQNF